jgi:hypothetical protein
MNDAVPEAGAPMGLRIIDGTNAVPEAGDAVADALCEGRRAAGAQDQLTLP